MSDNLQRFLPEYDEEEERNKFKESSREELLDLLITSYKLKRVIAKLADEERSRLERIREILDEPSTLANMPDVPGPDDLKRMAE